MPASAPHVLLVLLSVVLTLTTPTSTTEQTVMYTETNKPEPAWGFQFDPPTFSRQFVNTRNYIQINISAPLYEFAESYKSASFFIGVRYDKKDMHLTNMLEVSASAKVEYQFARTYNLSYYLFWKMQTNNSQNEAPQVDDEDGLSRNGFILTITSIGYPRLELHVIMVYPNNSNEVVWTQQYQVIAVRQDRDVDTGFKIAITVVGILNIFAIGCMTEVPVLRSQLKKSIIPVCLASGTQYVISPLLTFGLLKMANILPELAVGILLCSCVPGGGLGHLIVLITGNANPQLSVVINFLQIFVPIGTVPLWLYSLAQFLRNGVGEAEVPTHFMVMCLALLLVPYILGILLRHFKASAAEAVLNWLIKPLLLLFLILFITLGLYINFYAMGVLDKLTLAIAGLIPSFGFCIGGGLTLAARQGKASAKSVAIEAAIMNCLVVVAASKHTMPQPDADMACAGAIAVLFFTPVPFIGMLVFHKIKKKILTYFENRKYEKEHLETISKSFGVITQNALRLSGMTPNQVKMRREAGDKLQAVDNTLLSDEECLEEPRQTVVQIKVEGCEPAVETVSLSQANNRNYL